MADFAFSVAAGLASRPRRIDSRHLYDARGSTLFELITEQPEYYLTRTETLILESSAAEIRRIVGPAALVELGSGNSLKIDHLLRSWRAMGRHTRYIPVDVSESALARVCRSVSSAHPGLEVLGIHGDYRSAFPLFEELSPLLLLFLGSSIGNFTPAEMSAFLEAVSASITPGDFLLVGIDLVKEQGLIEAAYNDRAGVSAQFTLNLFLRMNRELESGVDIDCVRHEAYYNPLKEQVEIRARFLSPQVIHIQPLGERFAIAADEAVQTEISRKFHVDEFLAQAEEYRFGAEAVFTDPAGWFALVLLRRVSARRSVR